MPGKRDPKPATPSQVVTRLRFRTTASTQTPRLARVEPIQGGSDSASPRVPDTPARTRAGELIDRARATREMDQRQLIDALGAFTQGIAQDRAAAAAAFQQLTAQNQALIGILQAQQAQPAPAAPGVAPVAVPPRISQSVVETIPVFSGGLSDFPQDFVDCVDRIAVAEGWNDQQRIQVAVRRLDKTAKEWHNHSGHNQNTWADWSARLVDNFSPRIPYGDWMRQVQERKQRPGESGIQYALEKRKLLRLAPVPLGDAQTVAFLINGLSRWQHEGAMSANPPANFEDFLVRIRELESLDISAGPVHPQAPPVATASAVPFFSPVIPPPTPAPLMDLNRNLAAFEERLLAEFSSRLNALSVTPRPVVPGAPIPPGPVRVGRGRGAASLPDSRECYRCHLIGHIARDCPSAPKGPAGR